MQDRENLAAQAAALVSGQQDMIANAATLSALLFYALDKVNWVGFYFLKGGKLVVGPFQGRPACVSPTFMPSTGILPATWRPVLKLFCHWSGTGS